LQLVSLSFLNVLSCLSWFLNKTNAFLRLGVTVAACASLRATVQETASASAAKAVLALQADVRFIHFSYSALVIRFGFFRPLF
jgi:hypothetical protein